MKLHIKISNSTDMNKMQRLIWKKIVLLENLVIVDVVLHLRVFVSVRNCSGFRLETDIDILTGVLHLVEYTFQIRVSLVSQF